MDETKNPSSLIDVGEKELNYTKLLKSNAIIYGRMVKTNERKLKLNMRDYRVVNFLLRTLQECIRQNSVQPQGYTTIQFPIELYKQAVDNSQNWRTNLQKSVEKIADIKYELKDWRDPQTMELVKYWRINLLINPKFSITTTNDATLKVTFPQELAVVCWEKSRYTHLDFKTINGFKSKYALRFYEFLISKIQYFVNNNNFKTEYDIKQDELETIFEVEFKNIKNGFVNFLENAINFHNVVIPDLRNALKFEYEVYSADKIISFKFNEETIKKFSTKNLTEYDLALQKFANLIDSNVEIFNADDGTVVLDNQEISLSNANTVYTVSDDGLLRALETFLIDIRQYYYNRSLLEPKDIEQFGDIIMTTSGVFVEKDTHKPMSYRKKTAFLKFLYKNYYETIMTKINSIKDNSIQNKLSLMLNDYINKWLHFGSNFAKISSVSKNEKDQIVAVLDIFTSRENLLHFDVLSKSFENLSDFAKYVANNEVIDE